MHPAGEIVQTATVKHRQERCSAMRYANDRVGVRRKLIRALEQSGGGGGGGGGLLRRALFWRRTREAKVLSARTSSGEFCSECDSRECVRESRARSCATTSARRHWPANSLASSGRAHYMTACCGRAH